MSEQKSFKERVKETLISNAYSYKKYYVDYEYLLCSKAFEKCYKGTLEETDFDFSKKRTERKRSKRFC